MARTNILKCGQVFPTRSGNYQRAHGSILSRSAINQEAVAPTWRHKKGIFKVAPKEEDLEDIPPPIKIKELHIWYQPISKLYTDDCRRFPIRSRNGNKYIMIAYHCDSNTILKAPSSNRKNKHSIQAYSYIMKRLADRGHQVDVKILDNEVSAEFKRSIVDNWGAK